MLRGIVYANRHDRKQIKVLFFFIYYIDAFFVWAESTRSLMLLLSIAVRKHFSNLLFYCFKHFPLTIIDFSMQYTIIKSAHKLILVFKSNYGEKIFFFPRFNENIVEKQNIWWEVIKQSNCLSAGYGGDSKSGPIAQKASTYF